MRIFYMHGVNENLIICRLDIKLECGLCLVKVPIEIEEMAEIPTDKRTISPSGITYNNPII